MSCRRMVYDVDLGWQVLTETARNSISFMFKDHKIKVGKYSPVSLVYFSIFLFISVFFFTPKVISGLILKHYMLKFHVIMNKHVYSHSVPYQTTDFDLE